MAFTRVESWTVEPGRRGVFGDGVLALGWRSLGPAPRRLIATSASIAIHVAAWMFLLSRLEKPLLPPVTDGAPAITIIGIGKSEGEQPADDDRPSEVAPVPEQVAQPVSAVDAPEWSMVRIRVPRAAAARAQEAAPAQMTAASGGGGGSAGYDPYAGAAPENVDRLVQASTAAMVPNWPWSLKHDGGAELLRQRLRAVEPRIAFPLQLRLTLDGEGRIVSVAFPQLRMPQPTLARLTNALQGTRLPGFSASGTGQGRQLEISL